MKNDNALKKHHFWLLSGVVPLFTLIAVFMVSSSVGGEIADREKVIDDAKKAIAAKTDLKPKALLEQADKFYEKVSSKQGDLHKRNWDSQKHLFKWPKGAPALARSFEEMNLKFGAPLPVNEGQFDTLKRSDVYLAEFSTIKKDGTGAPGTGMADEIAPTQFSGGWQSILRHVNDFGQSQLTKDQVWLMMEDIWVQRSMLDAIRSINKDTSTFHRAKLDKDGNVVVDPSYDDDGNKIEGGKKVETPEDEKRKALFRNRTWAVDLELVREGNANRLTGTLTNLSDRLQLMGVGNVMTLHVWFSKTPGSAPLVFKIGGEFVPGKGAMRRDHDGRDVPANVLPIVPIADHVLPVAMAADEIVRVEQVFDIRTVPVKRIEALALSFRDSRNADKPLVHPGEPFVQPPPVDETTTATGGGDAFAGGGRGGSSQGPPAGFPAGPTAIGGSGNTTGKPQIMGGGPITSVIDGNKKRYLEATPQVRRMPVGIVVVVDQSYMQDVLLAFANSPLRFQITQVNWTRFRGTLSGIGPASGSPGGPGSDIVAGGGGTINFGGYGDPDAGPPRGGSSMGPPPGMGSVGPRPGLPGTSAAGPSVIGPMGPGPIGGFGSFPGSAAPTVSESQITSSLVELSIYGIVSLYEKYEAPKPPDAATTTTTATTPDPKDPTPAPKDATPAPKDPMPKDPMPKEPMPKEPAPAPAPDAKKMRRRVRR